MLLCIRENCLLLNCSGSVSIKNIMTKRQIAHLPVKGYDNIDINGKMKNKGAHLIMKKKIKQGICMVLVLLCMFAAPAEAAGGNKNTKKELHVLFVGNSMSQMKMGGNFYTIKEPLEKLAKAAGYSLDATMVTNGGAWLKYYAGKTKKYRSYYRQFMQALKSETWDYIFLQDYSKRVVNSADTEMYEALKKLKRQIKKYQPQAKIRLYMTCGYDNKKPVTINGKKRRLTVGQMQEYLAQSYFNQGLLAGVPVVPVGTYFERCRRLYPDIDLYLRDGWHTNYAGYYLAACCFFWEIYQEVPDGSGVQISGLKLSDQQRKNIESLVADKASMSAKKINLSVGESKSVSLKVKDTHSRKREVIYKSLDTSVARVNKKTGRVTAVKKGRTVIFAKTTGGLQAACAVYVK